MSEDFFRTVMALAVVIAFAVILWILVSSQYAGGSVCITTSHGNIITGTVVVSCH